jgi:hypothetical protein
MTVLSADKKTQYSEGMELAIPVGASKTIYAGGLVALDGSTRYAEAASDASGKIFAGVAREYVANGAVAAAVTVVVHRRGLFLFAISSCATTDVGKAVFVVDDQTVGLSTEVSNAIFVGVIAKRESATSCWVDILPAYNMSDVAAHIADTSAAHAASAVSIADAGSFTSTAQVEAALQEIYQSLVSIQGFVPLTLMQWREVSSMAVGNAAANGGLLASDTTPILQPINGATDGCQELVWAASNNDPIATTVALPPDLDDTADLVLHTRIVSGGTTDAVGFTVDTWFNEGDTKVSDTSETNQTATWAEKITTIAAADVPAGAQTITISLTPVAHTTNTLALSAAWLEYKTKLRTS